MCSTFVIIINIQHKNMKNKSNGGKDSLLPQLRIESELKDKFTKACDKRQMLNRSDVMRCLIIYFINNPDMKFEI